VIRKLALLLPLVFFSVSSEAQEDPVDRAQRRFEEGHFAEGRSLLLETLAETRNLPEKQALVLEALARFYGQLVGDLDQSAAYRRRILQLPLAPDDPATVEARENIAEQEARLVRYGAENAILAHARTLAGRGDETERESCIAQLRDLCAQQRDYPQLAVAYYYLGELSFLLRRNGEAYRAFNKAIQLRPAIGFYLPAPNRRDWVFRLWIREILGKVAWGFLGVALVVAAVLFYLSKPWRWFGLRHALLTAALVFSWWTLFRVVVWAAGRGVEVPSQLFQEPVYVGTSPGSPFSEILNTLFGYSLVGILGTFIFCVATARLRPRYTRSLINSMVSLLLFSSLLVVFYLRHCRTFAPSPGEGKYPFLGGAFCYSDVTGQTSYILIDPTAYPGFHENVLNVDEGEFREWFGQYASSDNEGENKESN
jgi:tetratricopeptide (TPR) repeat protein